jgi:hypothetical protein
MPKNCNSYQKLIKKDINNYDNIKHPTGKECKKKECIRYESYVKWQCGDSNLSVCMKCKWALPSNFLRKV